MKHLVLALLSAAWVAAHTFAQDQGPAAAPAPRLAWSETTVAAMASLPIQDGGRIKPLAALAASTLHLVHGRRDMKLDSDGDGKDDTVLSPTEWLLDVWCFPEQAAGYPLFRVENYEVFDALGIDYGAKKNLDYLSYRQLEAANKDGKRPGDVLFDLAKRYKKKDAKSRTGIESHLVNSFEQVAVYLALHQYLMPLASPYRIEGPEFQKRLGGKSELWLSELVAQGAGVRALIQEFEQKSSDPSIGNLFSIASNLSETMEGDRGLPALFPPAGSRADDEHWLGLGGVVVLALSARITPDQTAMLAHLEHGLGAADHTVRQRELVAFRDAVVARATVRGEFDKVASEARYLAVELTFQALVGFLIALLVVGVGWAMPRSKIVWLLGIGATVVPLSLLVADIVWRCTIRARPPITNLFDTFLFIAAVAVAAGVVIEIISKRRFAVALAPFCGALLIALARAFEVEDGKDQMAPLQAVLDTNYYLATHVTSINTGYAAGMFASLLGTTWLVMQALGLLRSDVAFHKALVRATYGATSFGLIFAVFGTIYGGVWANDSWGRFWGWDPKENGALLICIAQVALLHARMCGWVRDLGFCIGAALIGIVVAFSWFHVNLLEIGLHAYGFNSKTKFALFTYYWIEAGLVALAIAGIVLRRRFAAAVARATAAPAA